MPQFLCRFFSPRYLIKPSEVGGELPSGREAYKTVMTIAWPSIMESVLGAMTGFVDTIMVSGLGTYAIAAVGLTNQPRLIFLAFFLAVNVGITAIVARRKGEGDQAGANKCLQQALFIIVIGAMVSALLGAVFARPLIILSGAKADTVVPATDFFRIIMLSIFFISVSDGINAAQRGVGNTRITLRTNLTANIVNVIMNYLLIGGNLGFPKLGIDGSAIATVIGSLIACIMSFISVLRPGRFLRLTLRGLFPFDTNLFSSMILVSGSAVIEQLCLRVGFFMYAILVANLGTDVFAAHQIGNNVTVFSFSFGDGLGIAAAALVGQNLGKKRPDLSQLYGKVAQRISLMISTVLFFLFIFGGRSIYSIFTSDTGILSIGAVIMIIIAFISPGQTSNAVIAGSLRGAGDSKYVAGVSLISVAIIRPLLAYILCYPIGLGLAGAWLSMLIDMYIRLTLNFIRFSGSKWKSIII